MKAETMREYRKTATIRAVRYLGQHVDGVCTGGASCKSRGAPDDAVPHIHTLEGDLTVSHGDWIATGVQGERWAIKPDVFAATYALVAAAPAPPAPGAVEELAGQVETLHAELDALGVPRHDDFYAGPLSLWGRVFAALAAKDALIEAKDAALKEACDLIEDAEKDTSWRSSGLFDESAIVHLRAALQNTGANTDGR